MPLVAVHESGIGTKLPLQEARATVAIGGRADPETRVVQSSIWGRLGKRAPYRLSPHAAHTLDSRHGII
ncbi:MAG TPA: hypothetical protein VFP43_12485, partial [Mesorhizobium sp.]|nr:hypothetical protein [Mesorhizobium sp.]